MRTVGIASTAVYLPRRWVSAADLEGPTGIPTSVLIDRFGLRGKHVAGQGEHPSDMAVLAGDRALQAAGVPAAEVDAVVYFGSTWKDHPVWQAAPAIAHRLGCDRAFGLELDYVSCGTPVALRVIRNLLRAEEEVSCVLAVAASRESHLLDYGDADSRFALTFGDGAVAVVLLAGMASNQVLGSAMRSDGSLAHHVKVPAGGTVEPASRASVAAGRHHLAVTDLAGMKARLDEVSLAQFRSVAEQACKVSGATLADLDHLCVIHMKRSMHDRLVQALGLTPPQATYLDDTGHMSGVDPLLALHRAVQAGTVTDGDLVLLLAAGTGYTWAATVVRWGA
ncbi:MAG TPA: 3-oxoacyl-ACP synthase [Euzebya sp.]|nr:3-oxoacyl-ACP synthase [Euzebya sp.]